MLVTIAAEKRLHVSVIAFDDATVAALLAMRSGDPVALAGERTPKVWADKDDNARPGADIKAHALLTRYQVTCRRRIMQEQGE